MNEHYVVVADAAHLRIYAARQEPGQFTPGFAQVEAMDFPAGRSSYTDQQSDMAGRFQSSRHQSPAPGHPGARTGMSIDERLPMKREEARRRARDLASQIDNFLARVPGATWDFAAGPDLNHPILDLLSERTRRRLRRSVTKDLVHQAVDQLRVHFSNHH